MECHIDVFFMHFRQLGLKKLKIVTGTFCGVLEELTESKAW
jgi:hypothetical protein